MIVYVAGSSDEIDRARRWIAALRTDGIHVTSSWPENVAAVGSANPRDAATPDRARWANNCVDELVRAELIWFLAPAPTKRRDPCCCPTMQVPAEPDEMLYGHDPDCPATNEPRPNHGRGAYFEAGYAIAGGMHAVVSGDTKQSIFNALAHEFATDDEAFAFIQHLARGPR